MEQLSSCLQNKEFYTYTQGNSKMQPIAEKVNLSQEI